MPAANTTRSWAREIANYDDVPEIFKVYYQSRGDIGGTFPYTVYAPPDRSFAGKENARIISASDEEILILEKEKKQVISRIFRIEDINYIEMGTVLLYSWIKISGTVEGKPSAFTITFNTSTEQVFKPIADKARRIPQAAPRFPDTDALRSEADKFDFLEGPSFKFMIMARNAIGQGEKVIRAVFLPEVRDLRLKFFNKTLYRTVLESSVLILTDKELIILRGPEKSQIKLGGSRVFVPLGKIRDLSVAASSGKSTGSCLLRLAGDDRLEFGFGSGKLDEIKTILGEARYA